MDRDISEIDMSDRTNIPPTLDAKATFCCEVLARTLFHKRR